MDTMKNSHAIKITNTDCDFKVNEEIIGRSDCTDQIAIVFFYVIIRVCVCNAHDICNCGRRNSDECDLRDLTRTWHVS